MLNNTIFFKYYSSKLFIIFQIILPVISVLTIYLFIQFFDMGIAIFLSVIAVLIYILALYFAQKKAENLTGFFRFKQQGFEISTLFVKKNIAFSEMDAITFDYHNIKVDYGVATVTQPIPGKYTIFLKDDSEITLLISRYEQKTYEKSIRTLEKKIYKTNFLGVHFAKNISKDKKVHERNDLQFEKERPVRNYTLENAMNELSDQSKVEIDDLTDL